MKVRVAELGGMFQEVTVELGTTVKGVLDSAGVNYNRSKELRLNTVICQLDSLVADGDVVQLIPNVEGGRS